MYDFEKFPVYLLAEEVYKTILRLLERNKILFNINDQLERAGSSILLNIAEGAGKYSKKDKKKYYAIARGSAQECVAILRLLRIRKLIKESEYEDYYAKLTIITKMLSGLIRKMDR